MRINPNTQYHQKREKEANQLQQKYLMKIVIFIVLGIEIYFFIKMLI